MNKQFDITGIGEVLVELFETGAGTYKQSVAGDVFNLLFYASRLGLKTGFISSFGADHYTDDIYKLMDREGIDRSITSRSEAKNNGLYLVRTDEAGEPHYTFWRKDSTARETLHDIPSEKIENYILSSRYFHFSAIALGMLHEREKLISILERVHGKTIISFDTNFRKAVWDDPDILRNFLKRGSSLIDTLFVSRSDDRNIFGERTGEEALAFYKGLGYKRIIFRQGAEDVLVWDNGESFSVPAEKNVKVVDATAAGDAFNAGFINGVLSGTTVQEAVKQANRCSAYVLHVRGALAQNFHKDERM